MACEPHKYNGISQNVFDCVKQKVIKEGGAWEGDFGSGSVSFEGKVKGTYKGDIDAKTITLTVTKKPWIVSCDYVYGKIGAAISECEGAASMFGFIEADD